MAYVVRARFAMPHPTQEGKTVEYKTGQDWPGPHEVSSDTVAAMVIAGWVGDPNEEPDEDPPREPEDLDEAPEKIEEDEGR